MFPRVGMWIVYTYGAPVIVSATSAQDAMGRVKGAREAFPYKIGDRW